MEWHWLERQEKAFQAIKHNLTSDAVFSMVSGHFANVSLRKLSVRKRPRSIRKRNMNQQKSTEENHVTFNHYK